MALTLYKNNASDRKYSFLIVDLEEQAVAEVDSIKNAKSEIMALVEAGIQEEVAEEVASELAADKEPQADEQNEDVDVAEIASRALARQLEEMFEEDNKSKKAK